MSPQVKNMILEAEALSPNEQFELITAISELLHDTYQEITTPNDFWPKNESMDDFIEFIYKQRHENRMSY